jgi:hypothetical protein
VRDIDTAHLVEEQNKEKRNGEVKDNFVCRENNITLLATSQDLPARPCHRNRIKKEVKHRR